MKYITIIVNLIQFFTEIIAKVIKKWKKSYFEYHPIKKMLIFASDSEGPNLRRVFTSITLTKFGDFNIRVLTAVTYSLQVVIPFSLTSVELKYYITWWELTFQAVSL